MNCSAEKASRKWADGAFRRARAAMVTAAVALLWLGMQAEPAEAARRSAGFPWDDLFGTRPPRPRATARRAVVPLPKPRPAEAPEADEPEPEQPAADRQPPAGPATPAETAEPTEIAR